MKAIESPYLVVNSSSSIPKSSPHPSRPTHKPHRSPVGVARPWAGASRRRWSSSRRRARRCGASPRYWSPPTRCGGAATGKRWWEVMCFCVYFLGVAPMPRNALPEKASHALTARMCALTRPLQVRSSLGYSGQRPVNPPAPLVVF